MITVVLDTNILVSGLGWSGPPATILDMIVRGRLLLVTSSALLIELERVLGYPKLAAAFPDASAVVALIRAVADVIEPTTALAVVADDADNRVLEAATGRRADAIVTGDSRLLALGSYDGIPVLSATAFLDWLRSADA